MTIGRHKINITLNRTRLEGKEVYLIKFPNNQEIVMIVRCIRGAYWNSDSMCWVMPYTQHHLETLLKVLNRSDKYIIINETNSDCCSPENTVQKKAPDKKKETEKQEKEVKLPKGYLEILQRKRYSAHTIKTYTCYMKEFQLAFRDQKLENISVRQINAYILELIEINAISASQQNQRINAIKFYYEKVCGRTKEYYAIERPRKCRRLPQVLSEEEILSMIIATKNLKHKAIICTLYSAGLRRGELVNLRKHDIQFERKMIIVKDAKGNKDRATMLSGYLAEILHEYIETEKPNYWLFEGPGRNRYSATSIAKVIRKAAKLAEIGRDVTPHMLRHSFATHLVEQGISTLHIQSMLGHESSKTTEIYTHISKKSITHIRSPLDVIVGKHKNDSTKPKFNRNNEPSE
jgi:integrase/recombinase XerD